MTTAPEIPPASEARTLIIAIPGIAVSAAIAAAAYLVSIAVVQVPLNPIMLAVVFGALFSAITGSPSWLSQSLNTLPRLALRVAIVLLGFQISLADIQSIGVTGLVAVVTGTVTTLLFTIVAGRALGIERDPILLIAAGTSVCGIAAVIAMGAAIRANARDMTYAIICVTLFGLLSMVIFPLAGPLLGLDARMFGVWTGASIHEVAQVVAAGFQHSNTAGEVATVTKLSRVALLAPIVAAVALTLDHRSSQRSSPVLPSFLVGFVIAVIANSLWPMPAEIHSLVAVAASALFTFALAAIGISINVKQLFSGRGRELVLGLIATIWITGVTLAVLL